MNDFEQDQDDAPFDRIDSLKSEASEPKWPMYLGGVALVGFVGAFIFLQFNETSSNNASLIPEATVTPDERPSGGDLFGDVDLARVTEVSQPVTVPVVDPRIAQLEKQIADLQALLEAQEPVAPVPQNVDDTSGLEAQLSSLLQSQASLEGQLRAMEMRLQAQANRSPSPVLELSLIHI